MWVFPTVYAFSHKEAPSMTENEPLHQPSIPSRPFSGDLPVPQQPLPPPRAPMNYSADERIYWIVD